jgi:spermidine synthase
MPLKIDSSIWIESLIDGASGFSVRARHSLHLDNSPFQKIEVYETYALGRIMMLAGSIVYTQKDGFINSEMITHPAMISAQNPKRILIVGGGDLGSLTEILRYPQVESVDLVEIDKKVIECSTTFFPELASSVKDPRVQVHIAEGARWLSEQTATWDVIIVDSFAPGGPGASLETESFVQDLAKRLNKTGSLVIQTDSPMLNTEKIGMLMRECDSNFSQVDPYVAYIPSFPWAVCGYVRCGYGALSFNESILPEKLRYVNGPVIKAAFCLPGIYQEIYS